MASARTYRHRRTTSRDVEVVATGGGRRRDETRQHGGTAAAQPHPPPATDGGGTAGGHVCVGSPASRVERTTTLGSPGCRAIMM